MTIEVPGFTTTTLTFLGTARDVYVRGDGPAVIVMSEVPGITPAVARFARRTADAGFRVYMPQLFGTPMRRVSPAAIVSTFAHVCISREFRMLAADASSPIVDWLRALARHAHGECGGPGVGAVGMCLTGNFALAMMLGAPVIAPVLAQPSLPVPLTARHRAGLHASPTELAAAHELFATHGYAGTTMRQIAAHAGVSVPTLEQLFGAKANLLKACIDAAIAGDDRPVAMLERDWARAAQAAGDLHAFVEIVVDVLEPAQARSAALVIAAFEGSRTDPELAELVQRLEAQRRTMAKWIVDHLTRIQPLRHDLTTRDAIDSVWLLMDPVVHDRIVRRRRRARSHYRRWIADAILRLLFDRPPVPTDPRSRR